MVEYVGYWHMVWGGRMRCSCGLRCCVLAPEGVLSMGRARLLDFMWNTRGRSV